MPQIPVKILVHKTKLDTYGVVLYSEPGKYDPFHSLEICEANPPDVFATTASISQLEAYYRQQMGKDYEESTFDDWELKEAVITIK